MDPAYAMLSFELAQLRYTDTHVKWSWASGQVNLRRIH